MKIIVEHDWYDEFENWEEAKSHFSTHRSKKYKIIEEHQVIYYLVDLPYLPMEGQRVGTPYATCIVTHSYLNLDDFSGDFYFDNSRIVVTVE